MSIFPLQEQKRITTRMFEIDLPQMRSFSPPPTELLPEPPVNNSSIDFQVSFDLATFKYPAEIGRLDKVGGAEATRVVSQSDLRNTSRRESLYSGIL